MSVTSAAVVSYVLLCFFFFFFNDTATTEIYTLSLHDALPIYSDKNKWTTNECPLNNQRATIDRKSTRLNSSHRCISYAVFCLKKKKQEIRRRDNQPVAEVITSHSCVRERG